MTPAKKNDKNQITVVIRDSHDPYITALHVTNNRLWFGLANVSI